MLLKIRRRHEHINLLIVRTCIAYASIQNVKECSCYRLGMFLPLRRPKSAMGSMYFSFENERLPLQLVTMRIRFVRCAMSIFGNEYLIRLSIVSL